MSESWQIIFGLIFLAGVFILTRVGTAWKIQRAASMALDDLRRKGAVRPDKAVELPYAKKDWMKFGLRDFRPKAVESLVQAGVIVRTMEGRFYLRDDQG